MKTTSYYIFVLVTFLFTSILTSAHAFQKDSDKFVVVLDAGHGGKDPGRPTKFGYKEKNIALQLVLAVGSELEKQKDIKIIYTRKTDKFLELHERAAIANKADADLFISIHCNAHDSQAYGTETYVLATRANNMNIEIQNYNQHFIKSVTEILIGPRTTLGLLYNPLAKNMLQTNFVIFARNMFHHFETSLRWFSTL